MSRGRRVSIPFEVGSRRTGSTPLQARSHWATILSDWSRGRIFTEQDVRETREMFYDVTVRTPHAFAIYFRLVELLLNDDRRIILDLSKRAHFLVFQRILLRQRRVVAQDDVNFDDSFRLSDVIRMEPWRPQIDEDGEEELLPVGVILPSDRRPTTPSPIRRANEQRRRTLKRELSQPYVIGSTVPTRITPFQNTERRWLKRPPSQERAVERPNPPSPKRARPSEVRPRSLLRTLTE